VTNGFWDYGEHLLHAFYNPENGCVECALNHLGDAYTLENREVDSADKCIGTIEWVNRVYDTDWQELYAVSVDSSDSGIAVGGTLDAGGYRPAGRAGGGIKPYRNLPRAGWERESAVGVLLGEWWRGGEQYELFSAVLSVDVNNLLLIRVFLHRQGWSKSN